jgi:hypothetical protein
MKRLLLVFAFVLSITSITSTVNITSGKAEDGTESYICEVRVRHWIDDEGYFHVFSWNTVRATVYIEVEGLNYCPSLEVSGMRNNNLKVKVADRKVRYKISDIKCK